MPKKRESNNLFRSAEVAKILAVDVRTLYRMIKDGRVKEPARNPDNRYRLWTSADVQTIKEDLQNAQADGR